ncbi:MAG: hypothetical protein WC461_00865 [Candidatus Paceibacterota bacterium]
MKNLIKDTYMLDVGAIKKDIERLWSRYQKIIGNKKASWDELNEARAILYFLGSLYSEKIALEAIDRRIKFIKPKITLDKFFVIIDRNDVKNLKKYGKDEKFNKLKKFYLVVKNIKNRIKNGVYLDEEKFNEAYARLKPKNHF